MELAAAKYALALAMVSIVVGQGTPANETLWEAARAGDTARITAALTQGAAFTASPVGADGHLYVASEDGEVYVLSATSALTQLAKNDMKEVVMATPAISDGLVIVRTLGNVYGIGQ